MTLLLWNYVPRTMVFGDLIPPKSPLYRHIEETLYAQGSLVYMGLDGVCLRFRIWAVL